MNVINTALGQSLTYGVTDATGTAIMSKYYTVTKDIYYNGIGIKNNWKGSDEKLYKEYPKDNVKDFTIGELQNLLKTTNTLEELRNNVKRLSNLHGNSTTAIDNLFAKFVEHWRKYNPTSGAAGCSPQGSGGCVIYD